jgi:hypothetical protein
MLAVILKRLERPDETRTFDKGKFELVRVGGMTICRKDWWTWSGSNRRPLPCPRASLGERAKKAARSALPTDFLENVERLVDLVGIEPTTSSMPYASLSERAKEVARSALPIHNQIDE